MKLAVGNCYFGPLVGCSSLKPLQDLPCHLELWARTKDKSLVVSGVLFIAFISEL